MAMGMFSEQRPQKQQHSTVSTVGHRRGRESPVSESVHLRAPGQGSRANACLVPQCRQFQVTLSPHWCISRSSRPQSHTGALLQLSLQLPRSSHNPMEALSTGSQTVVLTEEALPPSGIFGLHSGPLNQNPHFNKIPGD